MAALELEHMPISRALLLAAFLPLQLALTLAVPVRAEEPHSYVGEDCRQDDCERIWINNYSDLGAGVYKTSLNEIKHLVAAR
jgi:hypothetical protein